MNPEPTPPDSTESGIAGEATRQACPAKLAPLKPRWVAVLAVLAVAAFHLGFLYAPLSWLVLVWLGCLFALRRTSCGRGAFYTGLAIGLGIYGPQLHFFWTVFGPAAVALWLVLAFWLALFVLLLAFWLALFVLLLHGVDRYWGARWAVALAPVLGLGIEFFRSELYYLRFPWLTAGSIPAMEFNSCFLPWLGLYGVGAWLMFVAVALVCIVEDRHWNRHPFGRATTNVAAITIVGALWWILWWSAARLSGSGHTLVMPVVAGVQLEFPKLQEVLDALNHAHAAEPKEEWRKPTLYLLSEYSFGGPIPDEIRAWCREKQRWLVAGGKEPIEGGKFYNTAFVVSTNGEVVFKQAKSVPIQFFNDGVPAPAQRVWDSPWGKIGIAICYDLSYARVVDRLIRQGARVLLVPAMDAIPWGAHEHRLNARMTPIRAVEYRVPIFRVASSGISQLVDRNGYVGEQLPFPGQGEVVYGTLKQALNFVPAVPWDRWLGPLAVLATVVILIRLGVDQRRARRRPTPSS
jgi:apolipoprotein N-acyltransferase